MMNVLKWSQSNQSGRVIFHNSGSIFINVETVGHLLVRRRELASVDVLLPVEDAPSNRVPDGHGRNPRILANPAGSELWLCGQRRRGGGGEMHGGDEATEIGSA